MDLEDKVRAALAHPISDGATLDPMQVLAEVLEGVGLTTFSAGGHIAFEGADPIIASPLPLATMAGVALMAKAVAAADIWAISDRPIARPRGQARTGLAPFVPIL